MEVSLLTLEGHTRYVNNKYTLFINFLAGEIESISFTFHLMEYHSDSVLFVKTVFLFIVVLLLIEHLQCMYGTRVSYFWVKPLIALYLFSGENIFLPFYFSIIDQVV